MKNNTTNHMTPPYKNYTAVVAIDQHGRIGRAGQMLWHNSEDLKWFADLTKFSTVVMGSTTYKSIGKPLTFRANIVITRTPQRDIDTPTTRVRFVKSLEQVSPYFLSYKVHIIGGAQIYKMFLPMCKDIWVTDIQCDEPLHEDDVYMPEEWKSIFTIEEKNPYKVLADLNIRKFTNHVPAY